LHIKKIVDEASAKLSIILPDKFLYTHEQDFLNSYINHKYSNGTYIVDFSNTSYLDSSGLSMIILLKDFADKLNSQVFLEYPPNSQVARILSIAGFNHIFPT